MTMTGSATRAAAAAGLLLAALCLAACAGQPAETARWPHPTLAGAPPLVIAHRGASGYRPEHTLEAYALAIDLGADVIEPDLVLTKDGALVARHDRYLSTTTNIADKPQFADRRRADPDPAGEGRVDWWVEDFTLAEIKALRARQPFPGRSKEFDDRFDIPTFGEVLALAEEMGAKAGRSVGVYPETKHPGYFERIGLSFYQPLLSAVEGFDAGPVFIQSFEPAILKRLSGRTAAKLVQLVYEETPGAGPNIPLEEIAQYADGVGPAKTILLDMDGGSFTPAYVQRAHGLGLLVHPWTFRDDQPNGELIDFVERGAIAGPSSPEPPHVIDYVDPARAAEPTFELEIYYKMGVDGVFSDFPDTAAGARETLAAGKE